MPLHAFSQAERHFDPLLAMFGQPNTAIEFDSTSLSGLTGFGTPDEESVTKIPGFYYLRDDAADFALCGRYVAAPSAPFTAVTQVSVSFTGDNPAAGVFVGEASPGVMESMNLHWSPTVARVTAPCFRWTNPTTFGTAVSELTTVGQINAQAYLAIRVNSASSLDYLWSADGRLWLATTTGRNPSITIGSVGIYMEAGGVIVGAAFGFLRIWHSALAFPGLA